MDYNVAWDERIASEEALRKNLGMGKEGLKGEGRGEVVAV
jgi:hypothetical protein